jgi:serine/threonine protein kinase
MSGDVQTRLGGLLHAWREAVNEGRHVTPGELCRDCPELLPELEKHIGAVQSMKAFLDDGSSVAPDTTASELPCKRGSPLSDPLPEQIGGYRVVGLLGEGGMGRVLRAEDSRLHRHIAVKVMRPEMARDEQAHQRFLREAQAAAALQHDNVVPVYQVGEDNGLPFIAMPLLAGESLETRLQREGKLPVSEVLRIGRETAEGLAAAHGAGLVHRDIKPANLWLEAPSWRVKVLDFGLARAQTDISAMTRPGTVLGTPSYMSPEQVNGESVDARTDLFSLGCVLYRAATGKMPFEGLTLTAVLRAVAEHQPPAPHEVSQEVPQGLSDLIMRLLAKNPSARPSSAEAVASSLAQQSLAPSPATLPFQPVNEKREGSSPRSDDRPGHGIRRTAVIGLCLVVAIAVGVILIARQLSGSSQGTAQPQGPAEGNGRGVAPAASAAPLTGTLVVRVWAPSRGARGLRIGEDSGAVPVREDEQLQAEVTLSEPAHAFLLWIDGKGNVTPLYPWNDTKIVFDSVAVVPPQKQARHFRNPSLLGRGWDVDDTAGLDTFLLLARRRPWPEGRSLADLLGKVPKAPLRDPGEVVVRGWDRGAAVKAVELDQKRGPKGEAREIDDQLLQLAGRLADDFELIRAVQFAHVSKGR